MTSQETSFGMDDEGNSRSKLNYDVRDDGSKTCTSSRARVTVVGIISFFLASLIILVVILTRVEKRTVPHENDDADCLGVAIIGQGLAGSYAAWRLRNKNMSISVFEMPNTSSGELYSGSFPEFPEWLFDLGNMYFMPRYHKLMNTTLNDLDLNITNYEALLHGNDALLYYLRGAYIQGGMLNSSLPYSLNDDEQDMTPEQLQRYYFERGIDANTTTKMLKEIKTVWGERLFDLRYEAFVRAVASSEGYQYIRDTLGDEGFHADASAAESYYRMKENQSYVDDLMTMSAGLAELPSYLKEEFLAASRKHALHTGTSLTTLSYRNNYIILNFTTYDGISTAPVSMSYCADSVIFSMEQRQLKGLDISQTVGDVREFFSLLEVVQATEKIFFCVLYDDPWWRNDLNFHWAAIRSDTPLGDVIDLSEGGNFVICSFPNQRHANYWRSVLGRPTKPNKDPILSASVKRHLAVQLSTVFNTSLSETPEPVSVITNQWCNAHACSARYHWLPSFDWLSLSKRLLKPFPGKRVYIAGSAYSDPSLQNWAEGALQSVHDILTQYMGLT